jgi:hypothetical protein
MPSSPAQPPTPEQPQSARADDQSSTAPGERDRVERSSDERYGPLTITRVLKDDARALILYGHDESPTEFDEATARESESQDGPA